MFDTDEGERDREKHQHMKMEQEKKQERLKFVLLEKGFWLENLFLFLSESFYCKTELSSLTIT